MTAFGGGVTASGPPAYDERRAAFRASLALRPCNHHSIEPLDKEESMIVFNLTTDSHPESFSTTRDQGRWIAGTRSGKDVGFTRAVEAFAETLPEGEHLLGVVTTTGSYRETPMLRLARVVREVSAVRTVAVTGATIDPASVA